MTKKFALSIALTIFLISTLTRALEIRSVKASGTIYIRANGSVDPATAPILSLDNITYIFTDNINDSLILEKDNILVDGAGYTLQGRKAYDSKGLSITERSNVTIKNMTIETFGYGIYLYESKNIHISGNNITANKNDGIHIWYSTGVTIYGNNIKNNWDGIGHSYSSRNNISENNIKNNKNGIFIWYSLSNTISKNNITNNNDDGIYFDNSSNNTISENAITANNKVGIRVAWLSSKNTILKNNITNNQYGIYLADSYNNYLSNNTMNGNTYNFGVEGNEINHFLHSVDASNTVDGKPIHYLVTQHELEVPPDAGYVALINCTEIAARNLALSNNAQGLLLAFTQKSYITNNTLTKNYSAMSLRYSSANRITENNITNNNGGVNIFNSSNNTISENTIAQKNFYGIHLGDSSNNTIYGNNIVNNGYGIKLSRSSNNLVYHNNLFNNTQQVYDFSWDWPSVIPSINNWDSGYPSGGNRWNDHASADLYNGPQQNETGSDGICDAQYTIDANNRDCYPLMASITIFGAGIWNGVPYSVSIISNSTPSNFQLNEAEKTISFSAAGPDQTTGFCRITIPNVIVQEMWQGNITIQIDGQAPLENRTWKDEIDTYIYFTYQHQEMKIKIIAELHSALVLLVYMAITIFLLAFARRRRFTP
jgi:parallel beta-helix repeat protein